GSIGIAIRAFRDGSDAGENPRPVGLLRRGRAVVHRPGPVGMGCRAVRIDSRGVAVLTDTDADAASGALLSVERPFRLRHGIRPGRNSRGTSLRVAQRPDHLLYVLQWRLYGRWLLHCD